MKYLLAILTISILTIGCGTDAMNDNTFSYKGNAQYQGIQDESMVFVGTEMDSQIESNKIAIPKTQIPFGLNQYSIYKVSVECNTYTNSCDLISITDL